MWCGVGSLGCHVSTIERREGKGEETHPNPLALCLGEHALYDHLRLNRDTRQALETEPNGTVELALRLFCEHRKSRGQATVKMWEKECGLVMSVIL